MAFITLKSRRDHIEVPNDMSRKIKERWLGTDTEKAASDDIVDVGWITFQYGQIKSIELTNERKKSEEDYDRPLTQQEVEDRDAMMKKARANLESKGLLKKYNSKKV